MHVTNDPPQTELASNFTVADYRVACSKENKAAIAEALRRRFTERYIGPVRPAICRQTHGFTMMAVSCLMIESLESFCLGWENSKGKCENGKSKSEVAFGKFFESHSEFACFSGQTASCFWKNVRCGIHHQAETTGGWKITRKTLRSPF